MDRPTWIAAFVAELIRLRPHLAPQHGITSRVAQTLAAQAYSPAVNPVTAAREAHGAAAGMKLWSVTWEGVFIGFARADDADEAIRLKQAQHPDIVGGEWTAVEVP